MIVNNKMANTSRVPFGSLNIGDAYLDDEDRVCIKSRNAYAYDNGEKFGDCLFFNPINSQWRTGNEFNDKMVLPVKTTLTIEPMDK